MAVVNKKPSLEEYARRRLDARMHSLIERRAAIAREAHVLYQERAPVWEDRAAQAVAQEHLVRLDENERAELGRVVAALARLADGTWGRCLVCGGPIAELRLRAAPEAVRCARCTNHHDTA